MAKNLPRICSPLKKLQIYVSRPFKFLCFYFVTSYRYRVCKNNLLYSMSVKLGNNLYSSRQIVYITSLCSITVHCLSIYCDNSYRETKRDIFSKSLVWRQLPNTINIQNGHRSAINIQNGHRSASSITLSDMMKTRTQGKVLSSTKINIT